MLKLRCCKCSKIATWTYMPGDETENYCDKHVPRGCSCQDDKSEPCCEYWYDPEGWDGDFKETAYSAYNTDNCTGMVDCLCNKCNAE